MKPKEKAIELTGNFKDHVNPYIGSGMLSNTHDDSAILWQAKKCALIAVDEILKTNPVEFIGSSGKFRYMEHYWLEVKGEIENL